MARQPASKSPISTVLSFFGLLTGLGIGRISAQIADIRAKGSHRLAQPKMIAANRAKVRWSSQAWWPILREAAAGWTKHGVSTLGAAISYYSLFSIGPLILIVITVAGLVFGEEAVRGQVSQQLSSVLGEQGAKGVEDMLAAAGRPTEGILATIASTGTLIFAAIGVVVQLKSALNLVWDAKPPEGTGIWNFFRTYAVSLAGVVSLGFLLLISMLLTTVLSALGSMLAGALPEILLQAASLMVFCNYKPALFHDVQMASRHQDRLARSLAGRRPHSPVLRAREVSYRFLYR